MSRSQTIPPEVLRAARAFKGMGQGELAEALKIPQSSVSRIEAGRRSSEVYPHNRLIEVLDLEPDSQFWEIMLTARETIIHARTREARERRSAPSSRSSWR